jgi:hypothetical protein
LDFESIFSRLKEYRDPVGAALDAVDKEFTRLRKLAEEAGEGIVEVEELYLIERQQAVEEAMRQRLGSLQDLYDDLVIGDSGLSLRARRDAALAEYTPLADRVRAGDVTAFDDFASAAQTVLPLIREIEGSSTGYFEFFNELKDLTKAALDTQSVIAEASANRDSPFTESSVPTDDNQSVVNAVNAMNDAITSAVTAGFQATNQNLGAIIAGQVAGNDNPLFGAVGTGGFF